MNSIELIRFGLESSKGWAQGLLNDMRGDPLVQPTDNGGNHPLWLAGHIAYGEAAVLDEFVHGRANRFEHWADLFGPSSTPVPDAAIYPSFDEVTEAYDQVRADTLAHLETLSESDLDARTSAPDDAPPFFQTVGGCYAALMMHAMHHAGQAADARRAAGRQPIMM